MSESNLASHPQYADEISLRDLYLIFRRGMPLIIVIALLAGAATFLFLTFQPERFEAQATVLVTPTPERSGEDVGSAIMQRTNVSYSTYESVAYSQRVLDATFVEFGAAPDEAASFRDRLSLANLVGTTQPGTQLIVGHTASARDADEAAELANIWSEQTVDAVTETMQAILRPIITNNQDTAGELASNLEALEEEWRAFQDRNDTGLLEAELTSFTTRNAQASERLDSIARDLASNTARINALSEALATLRETEGTALDEGGDALTTLLESRELLSSAAAGELQAFMQAAGTDTRLVELLLGLELQSLVAESAALSASRDATETQLAEYGAAAAERRTTIAMLSQERTELERRLRIAETLYTGSLDLQPVLSYISDVLPTNVRVLDEAAPPLRSASGGRVLPSVIAVVVGGLLATVFVFLRAAVMPPAPTRQTIG